MTISPQIYAWRAKRAGGRMTIYGKSVPNGEDRRVVGVDTIAAVGGQVVATDKNGISYVLAV